MALATLLLPSSGSTATKAATGGHRTDSRRHDHHHHHGSKRKKPPPSPQTSLPSSAPRTPPAGARSHPVVMAASSSSSSSRKSPMVPAAAAGKNNHHAQYQQRRGHHQPTTKAAASSSSSSWEQVKSLLSCRSATAAARVHDPSAPSALARLRGAGGAGTCGASLCAMRDVVDAASSASDTAPLNRRRAHRGAGSSSAAGNSSSSSSHHSSLRARGLSGCYECRAINVEPMSRRYPRPRELCACPQCGEVFTKGDTLEHHQAIRHAVSELGPEDSGRNIVEIIFKSSWQKRDRRSICHIDRILKVHNAPRTVARFEAYRDAVRSRCRAVVAARAAADGNELLRFHSAPLACALGLSGATALCCSSSGAAAAGGGAADASSSTAAAASSACGVCTAIQHGFAPWVGAHPLGVRTTASSGRAHDCSSSVSSSSVQLQPHQQASDANPPAACRAMLVCRVIAGRVRRDGDGATSSAAEEDPEGPFDSVAGEDAASSSVYGNLEELFVANPRAILPCFVVVYRVLDS